MLKELGPGLRLTIVFTVLTGIIYPVVMTGISEVIFPKQSKGSLVTVNGKVVGSSLIGQPFEKAEYFHPRPSAAGIGYDASSSGATNLGPTSSKLLRGTTKMDDKKNEVVDFDGIADRIVHYSVDNEIPYESSVPLDQFKDSHGDLDDVKLIKAFNDDKAPVGIYAEGVDSARRSDRFGVRVSTRTSLLLTPRYKLRGLQKRAAFRRIR